MGMPAQRFDSEPQEPNAEGLAKFKQQQKQAWASFAPIEIHTTAPAAQLVDFAGVRAGQRVLDVGSGTGVVAITAASRGANVTGLDLTPALLERARENAKIAGFEIDFHEGDVEDLPFVDGAFDIVVSQFGHMFAPRPEVAVASMLRVLKPGGTIAFSTWPPELIVGRTMGLAMRYLPPPPVKMMSPMMWGDPLAVAQHLGNGVTDLTFDRRTMTVPTLSLQHFRMALEQNVGPIAAVVKMLGEKDAQALAEFRREFDAITADYYTNNTMRQDYLITRARKE